MAGGVSANRLELLQIADAVARDKSIDKAVVLQAMEEAMQRAAKARYGSEKIRGHGIPEELDAILTRGSRVEPRVALHEHNLFTEVRRVECRRVSALSGRG